MSKKNIIKNNFALLIGINYTGTYSQLNGCQNDVLKMKDILITHYNFKEKNIVTMIDKGGYIQPTAYNIISQINSLYIKSKNKLIDEIYIHYSGHGSNIIDKNKDETDGMDECIVPLDYMDAGLISDDLIYSFLSKINPVKKITLVFDSCNSASCTDLPYSFTLNDSNEIIKQSLSKKKPITNNKNIFVLSGCLDAKVSYDVSEPDGTPCGLLSYNLRKTLQEYNYSCTIGQLLANIKKGFGPTDQTPVLSVNSNDYNINTKIFEKTIKNIQSNKSSKEIPQKKQTKKIKLDQSTKLTPNTIEEINNNKYQLENLYIQFKSFNEMCKNMPLEKVDKHIDTFISQIDKIKLNLDKLKNKN
jgi:hypothetical protein